MGWSAINRKFILASIVLMLVTGIGVGANRHNLFARSGHG